MDAPLVNYPGSKGGAGVAKRLISLMPPHRLYVEGFLGGGALLRLKLPGTIAVGIDKDPAVVAAWAPLATPGLTVTAVLAGKGESARVGAGTSSLKKASRPGLQDPNAVFGDVGRARLCADQADFLRLVASPPMMLHDRTTLLYCDPPYLGSTRTRALYNCELLEAHHHSLLLRLLRNLRCMVMISHYPCTLYDDGLKDWRRLEYRCMTRGGPRLECCWLNFPEPALLHDPRFAGDGFRARERIKRKIFRWRSRFAAMPAAERQLIASALAMVDGACLRQAIEA
jgi:DNA adenine methylase